MEIGDIISQSLKYPIDNIHEMKAALPVFALMAFPLLLFSISVLAPDNPALPFLGVLLIISVIAYYLIVEGYLVSVIREGINQTYNVPEMDIKKNVVDTIKVWIIALVYSIVPVVILFILSFVGIAISGGNETAIGAVIILIMIIYFVVGIAFSFLLSVAMLRFAHYDSLSEAFNYSEIIGDLKSIGIIKMFILFLALTIILVIILIIGILLSLIPILGALILGLVILPYVYMVSSYAFGLLYSDVAKPTAGSNGGGFSQPPQIEKTIDSAYSPQVANAIEDSSSSANANLVASEPSQEVAPEVEDSSSGVDVDLVASEPSPEEAPEVEEDSSDAVKDLSQSLVSQAAADSKPAESEPLEDLGTKIGIVFSIDDLGGGLYGAEAFKIFYRNLDPSMMGTFTMYDGDTRATLSGSDYDYCIAVESFDKQVINYVKKTMSESSDKGLAPINKRFILHDKIESEPLVYSANVSHGRVSVKAGGPPAWGIEEGSKWTLIE